MKTKNNLQSMEKLLEICTGLGDNYKPGNQKLQVEAMTTLLSQAQTLVNAAVVADIAHDRATNNREVSFSDLGKLATRLLSALIVSGASPQQVADARGLVHKITGSHYKTRLAAPSVAATTTGAAPATKRRARGRDYASTVQFFSNLIGALAAEPGYQPNEFALQIATLKDKLSVLSANNHEVIATAEALRQARSKRDAVMHSQSNSVCKTGQLAKAYVMSVYGFGSDNHKAVRKLSFNSRKV